MPRLDILEYSPKINEDVRDRYLSDRDTELEVSRTGGKEYCVRGREKEIWKSVEGRAATYTVVARSISRSL